MNIRKGRAFPVFSFSSVFTNFKIKLVASLKKEYNKLTQKIFVGKDGGNMASVFDVAKYVLHKCGKMSTWKLQKMCYYSQAWHIAWTGHELFPEDFEAWANGPVCPELFHVHKGRYIVGENEIPKGDYDELTDDESESVDVIIQDYGYMEPYELRELTHCEAPWKIARGNTPNMEPSNAVITKESMGEYYGSL